MKKLVFAEKVLIGLSDVGDGDMQDLHKTDAKVVAKVRENQRKFFAKLNLKLENVVRVRVNYDAENFCRYGEVDAGDAGGGILPDKAILAADSLATRVKDLGLFLPLADCLGVVIFDPTSEVLCVAHLGRHATEQFGARKTVEFLSRRFDSKPENLRIWLSPAAGQRNYPLFKFDNKSLREVNMAQFLAAGISRENISGEEIDTTSSRDYFSHSWVLKLAEKSGVKLKLEDNPRFAIVAKII